METQEQKFPYAQQCLCWSWSNRSDPPKLKKGKGRQGGKGGRSGQGKGHGSGQTNSGQVSLEKYPTDRPKSRKIIPSCFFCVAKQKAISGHWINECPQLTALNKKELVQLLPDVCLGCLRRKKSNSVHKCPPYLMKASNAEGTFCASCKCHKKLCTSPNLHQAVTVPESFAGAGLMETDYTLVASSVVANTVRGLKKS